MKHFSLSVRAGDVGALAPTTIAGLNPTQVGQREGTIGEGPAIQASPGVAARWFQHCFKVVCDATGITDAICHTGHQRYHRLHRVEFGGGYICHCEKCGRDSYVQR